VIAGKSESILGPPNYYSVAKETTLSNSSLLKALTGFFLYSKASSMIQISSFEDKATTSLVDTYTLDFLINEDIPMFT